jgi:hypothetical protein
VLDWSLSPETPSGSRVASGTCMSTAKQDLCLMWILQESRVNQIIKVSWMTATMETFVAIAGA